MLRIEEMARLRREADLTAEAITRRVRWVSREHAAEMFPRYAGSPALRPALGSIARSRQGAGAVVVERSVIGVFVTVPPIRRSRQRT